MSQGKRINRINDEILKEVSQIIRSELKDPRVTTITSVTQVDTSSDLKYCKIYVSILGNEEEKGAALVGLKNSQNFIRKQLAQRINLRNTPEIKFELDNSLEYSMKISKLIDEANKSKSVEE